MSSKLRWLIIVASLVLLGTAWNIYAPCRAGVAEDLEQTELKKTVGDVQFDAVPLSKTLAVLSQRSGLRMSVDWESLAKVIIEPQMPVTLRLHDVSFETALTAVMQSVQSAGGMDMEPGFLPEPGGIRITAGQALARFVVRIYDVSDLIKVPDDWKPIDYSHFQGSHAEVDQFAEEQYERVSGLEDVITNQVGTNREIGPPGFCQADGRLIVIETPNKQRLIAGLLERMRQVKSARSRGEPTTRGVDALQP